MKIQMTAQVVDENGKAVMGAVTKEVEVPDITEYGNKDQFYELFSRYETAVIQERNELTAEVTKEYLESAAALKKYGEIAGL